MKKYLLWTGIGTSALLIAIQALAAENVVVVPLSNSTLLSQLKADMERGFSVVQSASGRYWLDRNLGALRPATRSKDPDAYGDLYQWGRFGDGHQLRSSNTYSTPFSTATPDSALFVIWNSTWHTAPIDTLWQGVNGQNNPCPQGFRIPTQSEWQAEIDSWSSQNAAGALASPLKLPFTGYRDGPALGGSVRYTQSSAFYWSSTIDTGIIHLFFNDSLANANGSMGSANGASVRCIQN